MDTLLGRPMEEAAQEVPLGDDVKAALLGAVNRYRVLFEIALGYEQAKWDVLSRVSAELGLEPSTLTARYLQAVEWTERVFRVQ